MAFQTSTGPTGFDPYRAWLNVREVRRPLNAYQLLELPLLEEDVETIRAAAGTKRAALAAHRDEATDEIWQQIYLELEEAITILLDPDKKSIYDLALQVQEQPTQRTMHAPRGAVTDKTRGARLRCRHCHSPNPATRRFCANCGKPLWEPCFQCGTLCSSGEKFCGACGVNLTEAAREHIDQFDVSMAEVQRMLAEKRFDDAVAMLGPLARSEHPRLSGQAGRAAAMLKQIVADRERATAEAAAALGEAQRCFAEHHYEATLRILDEVPAAVRNAEINQLLQEVQLRREEIAQLNREIREGIRAGRALDLLPSIERLLTLKPDEVQARQLAQQFQEHLCKAARERLMKFQYQESVELLERLPESIRTPETGKLYEQALELSYLAFDLRNSPFVDASLVKVGERLRKYAPGDPRTAKLVDEMKRRWAAAEKEPRRTALPWAAAPEKCHVGYPIEWVTGFGRLRYKQDLDRAIFLEHPACFFVAAGLALQGLGQSSLSSSLLPEEKSVLGRMGHMMRKRSAHTAWGVDLGTTALKAVKLAWDEKLNLAIIEAADYVEYRKALSQATNPSEETTILEEAVRVFQKRNTSGADRVGLSLPGRFVLSRSLKLPPLDPSKVPQAVQYEARHHIPYDLDDTVWDYELIGEADLEGKDKKERRADKEYDVLLLAAKKSEVSKRTALLKDAGLKVDIVQTDCAALHNFWSYENYRKEGQAAAAEGAKKEPSPDDLVAIVDLGGDAANIIVSSPNLLWFRSLGVGSQSFSRILVQEFNLTFAKAEEVKRNPTAFPRLSKLHESLAPAFEDFVQEINRSLSSLTKVHEGARVKRMVGIGGGLQLHGLLRYLRWGR